MHYTVMHYYDCHILNCIIQYIFSSYIYIYITVSIIHCTFSRRLRAFFALPQAKWMQSRSIPYLWCPGSELMMILCMPRIPFSNYPSKVYLESTSFKFGYHQKFNKLINSRGNCTSKSQTSFFIWFEQEPVTWLISAEVSRRVQIWVALSPRTVTPWHLIRGSALASQIRYKAKPYVAQSRNMLTFIFEHYPKQVCRYVT